MQRCDMSLGDILVHMGACTEADVARARAEQEKATSAGVKPSQIGALLVRAGVVTAVQVDEALKKQRAIRRSSTSAVGVLLELARRQNERLGTRLAAAGGR